MTPPSPSEIQQATMLAEGVPGVARLLAEMLAALSITTTGAGETRSASLRVLDRLTAGPLPVTGWPGLASSQRALYVIIYRLRQDGYRISRDGDAWVLEALAVAA